MGGEFLVTVCDAVDHRQRCYRPPVVKPYQRYEFLLNKLALETSLHRCVNIEQNTTLLGGGSLTPGTLSIVQNKFLHLG